MYIYIYIYIHTYIHTCVYARHVWVPSQSRRSPPPPTSPPSSRPAMYTRSPLEDSRLFGPSPLKILATTCKTNDF